MQFGEDERISIDGCDATPRAVHLWLAAEPQAVVLAIHGGMSHAGDYQTWGEYGRERGISTVSMDLHGHAQGPRVDIQSFDYFLRDTERLLDWIKQRFVGLPVFVVGHSMGGLIGAFLGLTSFANESVIKGYIFSSPYWVNAIKVPWYLEFFAQVLAVIMPKASVPVKPFTHVLTHDELMLARIEAAQANGLRGIQPSFRLGAALMKAQKTLAHQSVDQGLASWHHPLLVFLAGQDQLTDSQAAEQLLRRIPAQWLTLEHCADNYHENFNELNRQQIFDRMRDWMVHQR